MPLNQINLKPEMEEFGEHLEAKELSERTIYLYKFHVLKILKALLSYSELEPQSIINKLLIKNKNVLFRSALKNYLEFRNITELIIPKSSGRKPHKQKNYITPEDVELLMFYADDHYGIRYALMILISYSAGLRRNETLNLKVEDFGFKQWLSNRRTTNCRVKITMLGAKGKKERYVFIDPSITKEIYNYITENREYLRERENFVFPIGKSLWDRLFRKCCYGCNFYKVNKNGTKVSDYTLHDLRRSIATKWFRDGKDLHVIKRRLGHSDIPTTELYINEEEDNVYSDWENE